MQTPQWKAAGIVSEGGQIDINGMNPWQHTWNRIPAATLVLPHPSYSSQSHQMDVYRIEAEGRQVEFAAAEVSAGVWAFYIRNN